jgi:hypothetical protein
MGGINFIAIDDSTYQVSESQLAFYRAEIARGLPTILLMHIPLPASIYNPGPAGSLGGPRPEGQTNLPSTMEFVKAVRENKNLVAVLTGHYHQPLD